MSYRNNDVFQVLPTSGNAALLTAGGTESDLAVGQLGVFDANTGLSVTAAVPRHFYFALGIDPAGTGSVTDVRRSAGQYLRKDSNVALSFKAHTAGQPMIVEVSDLAAKCEADYTIRVEQRNARTHRLIGFNQYSRAFSVRGACCDDCVEGCGTADPNDIAIKMVNEINNNSGGELIAELRALRGSITIGTAPTADGNLTVTLGDTDAITVAILNADDQAGVATKIAAAINAVTDTVYHASASGATVTIVGPAGAVTLGVAATGTVGTTVAVSNQAVTDGEAFLADNPTGAVFSFRIQSVPVPTTTSSSVNLHYYKFHQTYLIVSLVEGFDCHGTVTTIQELAEAEGTGANIRQLEYKSSAWHGADASPYVLSEVTGTAREGDYLASASEEYDQFILESDYKAESGWLEYQGPLSTIFAVPATHTTTRGSLATFLDLVGTIFGGEALADDAAAANVDPDVVEIEIADVLKDGLA